jgi:hypothetical protein
VPEIGRGKKVSKMTILSLHIPQGTAVWRKLAGVANTRIRKFTDNQTGKIEALLTNKDSTPRIMKHTEE